MKCPACDGLLSREKSNGVFVDVCSKCRGIWFDDGKLRPYARHLLKDSPPLGLQMARGPGIPLDGGLESAPKQCPRCYVDMERVNYAYNSNIMVDKCPLCSGLWTDNGEALRLSEYVVGSEKMKDIGAFLGEIASGPGHAGSSSSAFRKIIAGIAAVTYIGAAIIVEGNLALEVFFSALLDMALPVVLIFFSGPLGGFTGSLGDGPSITRTTPGFLVEIMGWGLLAVRFVLLFTVGTGAF